MDVLMPDVMKNVAMTSPTSRTISVILDSCVRNSLRRTLSTTLAWISTPYI
jgi:hypothetical protein